MDDKDKLKIELLIKQYDDISNNLRNTATIQQQLMTVGILLVTGVLIYSIEHLSTSSQLPYILLILLFPFIFLGILLFGAFTHAEIMGFAGYKRYLEEEINVNFGEGVFLYESFVVSPKESSLGILSDVYNFMLYLSIYLILSFYSLNIASEHSLKYFLIIALLLLGGLYILLKSLYKAAKKREDVYQKVKAKKRKTKA